MEPIKGCPWCGELPQIVVCDEEGNIKTPEYEQEPWSGLTFGLIHPAESGLCPIYVADKAILGNWLYDTRDEAIAAWNARKEPEHAEE